MKGYAREADALMNTFRNVSPKWKEDMQIDIRGIVDVRRVPTKAGTRPDVNVEDDDELVAMAIED